MTWHEFIIRVSERTRMTQVDVRKVLETTFNELPVAARDRQEGFRVPDFGTFYRKTFKSRRVLHPYTKEPMEHGEIEMLGLRTANAQKRRRRS